MNDTLMRSPNDDWSIQKTDQESITINRSGMTTSRTMKKDFRSMSMLKTKVEATPSLPACGAGWLRIEVSTRTRFHCGTRTASAPPDPDAGNDSDDAEIAPLAADMAVTKTVNNIEPDYLETVTFTVEVTNNGPDDAVGVEVTDLLPAGLTFAGATTMQGAYTSGTGVWDVGPVNVGEVFTLTLEAVVNTLDPVTNTAEITDFLPTVVNGVIGDPDPGAGNSIGQ